MQTLPSPHSAEATSSPSFQIDDWRSGYRSQPEEYAYWIDDIEGEIPTALEGTLFRNGPGLLDIGGHPIRHPFDGDGMISSIAFKDGKAYYRNRFVRTEGYVAEQEAGKPLYRGVFGTQKIGGLWANMFDLRLKNIANTHIIYWGHKLLALWEAAEPHRLDPETLETIGLDYLDGLLQPGDAFAAHPKIDPGNPDQGQEPRLVNFSIKTGLSSTITIHEFDISGNCVKSYHRSVPGFAFMHDFVVTPNYVVFFQNPVSFNPFPFVLGMKGAGECIQLNPKAATKIIVIPRNGETPVQFIDAPAGFVFHHANAFEQAGKVFVDSIVYQGFPTLDEGTTYQDVDFSKVPEGQLWRFTLDLDTEAVDDASCLISRCCEFPTLHPQQVGQPYRYLYIGAAHRPSGNAPLQALLKKDFETGEEHVWSEAPRGFMGEPIFVPRPDGTVEDDGWVLCLTYNAARQCSDLIILDAKNIQNGPIARLKLKHHVPYGLHGSFTSTYFGPTAA
ncbi:carotenoid oxygenase family protein [Oscillatoria sp. CS-180]|uniref:carotenoid oxygenase family protein n=1 Tax=Oscillatoria sp. CS-180 TaxID=3021720 RepID=UPI00232F6C46|nr:carotenoid oxygenase family protein [Oscillatoria sp. CS-180]MDB9528849.1 carotenoid oxygenase family protein [Oscillatoria sp. CS-180]